MRFLNVLRFFSSHRSKLQEPLENIPEVRSTKLNLDFFPITYFLGVTTISVLGVVDKGRVFPVASQLG